MSRLWIKELASDPVGTVVLELGGQITGRWVGVLLQQASRILDSKESQLALDLSRVSFISPRGQEALRGLARQGASLRNCSPLIAEALELSTED